MPSYAAVIGGVVALGFLIWTIWTQNPRQIPHEENNFNPGPGYDRPRDAWTDDENDTSSSRRRRGRAECPICRESLAQRNIKNLPCRHIFHDDCISEWFQQSRTCPTCRQPA